MSKLKLKDQQEPDCPIRNILSRFGDKWSILIFYTLERHGVMRFNELQRAIPDISQKMLTVTLRILEEDGFVQRTIYPVVPPKVEYVLTARANSLLPHLNGLICWAKEHMEEIINQREINQKG